MIAATLACPITLCAAREWSRLSGSQPSHSLIKCTLCLLMTKWRDRITPMPPGTRLRAGASPRRYWCFPLSAFVYDSRFVPGLVVRRPKQRRVRTMEREREGGKLPPCRGHGGLWASCVYVLARAQGFSRLRGRVLVGSWILWTTNDEHWAGACTQ